MNRDQLKHLAVTGTVSFPATFPRLAELRLESETESTADEPVKPAYLSAVEHPSVRVSMKRMLPLSDVRAVFLPRDMHRVDISDGTWLLGSEIEVGIRNASNGRPAQGIVYVAEQTATLLEVRAGMTAAESTQYYPPLPVDRSVNHYDPYREAPLSASGSLGGTSPTLSDDTDLQERAVAYCEPDYLSRPYQTLRPCEEISPAPYPADEKQR